MGMQILHLSMQPLFRATFSPRCSKVASVRVVQPPVAGFLSAEESQSGLNSPVLET